jgi:hypothetical protein
MDKEAKNRKSHLIDSFKEELARLFMVSFGVFLFILFFQPFPLGMLDYNNRLLYVTGFGVINFISEWVILILLPFLIPRLFKTNRWESGPPIFTNIVLLVITGVAYAFYIRFVGQISLSLYIMFKVFLVCLLPMIILSLLYKNKSMESQVSILQEKIMSVVEKLKGYEKTAEEEDIEITSENKSDKLILKAKNIVMVKSADNYIEVYCIINNLPEKKLIRNTLKSIELQLTNHKDFVRCHRTSIVNIRFVDKVARDFSGYFLKMNHLDEKLAVSRPFLSQVKEAISLLK